MLIFEPINKKKNHKKEEYILEVLLIYKIK